MAYKILIINPGSTSTKIGVYEDETQVMEETLRHSTEEIAKYETIYAQKDFRKEVILNGSKPSTAQLAMEASKRFGKEKIIISLKKRMLT